MADHGDDDPDPHLVTSIVVSTVMMACLVLFIVIPSCRHEQHPAEPTDTVTRMLDDD